MLFKKNRTKNRDMAKQDIHNEDVNKEAGFVEDQTPSCTGEPSGANVADPDQSATDTMAEPEAEVAPSAEELVAEWKDKYVRLQAEFDNYRKRTLREKMELVETGGQDVLKAVLPVVDDVQRAVEAMAKSDDVEALRRGVELIAQKFTETLKQKKVVAIEAKGLLFDEELMEAVAKFPAGEEQRGKVIDVVQTGYMLGEKVLRFAKVVVGE